jgi:hypothetical protein
VFTDSKTREKHGRKKRFRRLISRFPTAKLAARLTSMTAEQQIAIVAVDPACTSRWGAEHWQKPTSTPTRPPSQPKTVRDERSQRQWFYDSLPITDEERWTENSAPSRALVAP